MRFANLNSFLTDCGFFDFHDFDNTLELVFCDLFFCNDRFTRFYMHLSSFVNVKKLTFEFINSFDEPLRSLESKHFFNVLRNLPNLEIIEFSATHSLSDLSNHEFKHFFENLLNLNGVKIKLLRNDFTTQQIQYIRNIEKKYANQILVYFNFTKIFRQLEVPEDTENVIKLFIYDKKKQDYFSRIENQLKEQRLIKSCFFSNRIKNMNESSEFENYAAHHGGKAKAGALVLRNVPRGTNLS